MTDESGHYQYLRDTFAQHKVVRPGRAEYVSLEHSTVHTNTIEGYFSIFKRGMKGVSALRQAAPSSVSGGVRFQV